MELLMDHLGKGFINILLISMPVVLVAAFIGLVIGILQAVTQVQEQTISAAPKILGVFLTIMIMGAFFSKVLTEYLVDSINLGCHVVAKQGDFVLPPEDMSLAAKKKFYQEEKDFFSGKRPKVDQIMKNPGKVPFADKREKFSVKGGKTAPVSSPNFAEINKMSGR